MFELRKGRIGKDPFTKCSSSSHTVVVAFSSNLGGTISQDGGAEDKTPPPFPEHNHHHHHHKHQHYHPPQSPIQLSVPNPSKLGWTPSPFPFTPS
ncbi:hypothetical protein M0802_005788 [Mischocyttarus mexicanus]|nr:hypothetical protein M0802_005788 [Mischocyttarus mexicanus]